MLRALEVRDLVLIEHASLELAAGFTALTGETGAGKSILVDAIELLVGGRADAAFVREGEWHEVAAEHKRLQHGSSLLAGAQSSLEALTEADGAALAQLRAVANRLRSLSENDAKLQPVVALLESAEAQAGEAVRELRNYASRVEVDPDRRRG